MIEVYFEKVEKSILYFENVRNYSLSKKVFNSKQGFIKGNIAFSNWNKLDFIEVKDIEIAEKIKYRYHYMDKNKKLIFRFDNAKHHKELKTYPHHKHSFDMVCESHEVDLFDVLLEIQKLN
jgi:hypothetical protein